jgi:hypothetical protein
MRKMIGTQPWAAIAAPVFLALATRAFWSVIRTSTKQNHKDRLEIRPLTPIEIARFVEGLEIATAPLR